MSDSRDFLHRSDPLSIELLVDGDVARIIVETDGAPDRDLTAEDDFVIVFDGTGLPLHVESTRRASAELPVAKLEAGGVLMIRVHEFLDGWEF